MSWVVNQKSKTGNTQFLLSKYSSTLNTSSPGVINSELINSIGYTNGVITYKVLVFNVALSISLECSNDGINFFKFKTNTHTTTTSSNIAEYFDWTIPVSFVRLNVNTSGTTTIGNINLNCTTSGGGGGGNNIDGNINLSGNILPDNDNTYDIGTSSKKIRDIYVSENSIWIGDKHKMAVENGEVKFKKRSNRKIPDLLRQHPDFDPDLLRIFNNLDVNTPLEDIKLHQMVDYTRILSGNETIGTNEIYTLDDDGFEDMFEATNSDNIMRIGNNMNTIEGDQDLQEEFRLWFGNTTNTVTLLQEGSSNSSEARIKTGDNGEILDFFIINPGTGYTQGEVILEQDGNISANGFIRIKHNQVRNDLNDIIDVGSGYSGDEPIAEFVFNRINNDMSIKVGTEVLCSFSID